ncbi:MalY/PatB family protein [Lactobacillus helveticus]|uniref:cysteine-S-conjugate beta-lyase n=1 Tax=Lactobacillus helveticus TaxID=1587 RepID=A0A3S8SAZ7_LACHE|nr:PatB family C-S lyase [Lactobacillus helveticus]AFR22374.1 Aminotransferase, class I/II [Lactobacillus helveticus R0052]AZK91038.1 Cystathionine beta-lyase PatB [Lactobacillus helveticus]MCJ2189348.1 PatB family C-S lyase [Lactobacillus helveticus]MED7627289.1 putative C-S lyase [Lactobacillus helveticus]MZR04876.1 putative C-S lyase [Lactobacillus helveticus]
MEYDFENAPDRSHTDLVKWDIKPGELPMWIADMDFKTAPEIIEAMQAKISLGAFGYEWPKTDYFNAVADWYETEHGCRPHNDWMIFTTGVVPAISSIVRRVSHIGDNVLVQEPVYNIFYNSILNNVRHVLSSDLAFDGKNYSVDWTDLEEKLANPLTTLMIFCNPHNPIGKVWTKAEVQRVAQLCQKHHVVLLSDEIHGDLVRKGQGYTPAFSIEAKSNVIFLVSRSKTFNVAALHAATAIVPDENLRNIVNRGLNSDEVAEPNLLAILATIAAYEEGHGWLKALKQQLNENFAYVSHFIQENIPEIRVISGDATYLMWINVQKVANNSAELVEFLRKETGLIVSAGSVYRGNGQDFIRINLACPLAMVKDGMNRLAEGIRKYSK